MEQKTNLKDVFDTSKNCIVNGNPCTQKEYWLSHLKKLSEKEDLSYQDIVDLMNDINMNVDPEDRLQEFEE